MKKTPVHCAIFLAAVVETFPEVMRLSMIIPPITTTAAISTSGKAAKKPI